jgi:hypothetical protein
MDSPQGLVDEYWERGMMDQRVRRQMQGTAQPGFLDQLQSDSFHYLLAVRLGPENDHALSMFDNLASGKLPAALANLGVEEQPG